MLKMMIISKPTIIFSKSYRSGFKYRTITLTMVRKGTSSILFKKLLRKRNRNTFNNIFRFGCYKIGTFLPTFFWLMRTISTGFAILSTIPFNKLSSIFPTSISIYIFRKQVRINSYKKFPSQYFLST